MDEHTGHGDESMPGMDMGEPSPGGESMPGMDMDERNDVGVHGMLLFGEGQIYLSHLPMFGPPHNFQVLLRVSLSAGEGDARSAYLNDRATAGSEIYTFVPEEFPLRGLVGQFPDPPAITSFPGTLFRGHFERGGTPLVKDVSVTVDEVLHFEELDPEAEPLEGSELTYLCFGEPGELYLAHQIRTRPNFDHVVPASPVAPDMASRGFPLAVPVDVQERPDTPEQRLKENEEISGLFRQSIGPGGQHGFSTGLKIGPDIYLEVDELA